MAEAAFDMSAVQGLIAGEHARRKISLKGLGCHGQLFQEKKKDAAHLSASHQRVVANRSDAPVA